MKSCSESFFSRGYFLKRGHFAIPPNFHCPNGIDVLTRVYCILFESISQWKDCLGENPYNNRVINSFTQQLHLRLAPSCLEFLLYPTRKTFAMWKIAKIGQGNHKKAWKQEIRREHNSNPLQRQSHVLVVSHVFPANMPCNFYWWSDDKSLYIYYTSILECAGT